MSLRWDLLDSEQTRLIDKARSRDGIYTIVGPPGAGKTWLGTALGLLKIYEGGARRVLLDAYPNRAADEFAKALPRLTDETQARNLALRTGFLKSVSPNLLIDQSNSLTRILVSKIVVSTSMSLKHLRDMHFDHVIVDEGGITRLEHLLMPLKHGVNPHISPRPEPAWGENGATLMDFLESLGIQATILGDPKQSRPISPRFHERSGIEITMRKGYDTLHNTHRMAPDNAHLVNDFARYGGLESTEEARDRRLILNEAPTPILRAIINPEDTITMVNVIRGGDEPSGLLSTVNRTVAAAVVRICRELVRITRNKSILVMTVYGSQRDVIEEMFFQAGLSDIPVATTSGGVGVQADIVVVALARNNPEFYMGKEGDLPELNVAISRAREKLIIVGNIEMLRKGLATLPTASRSAWRSPSRDLGWLLEHRYSRVVDAPLEITIC